MSKRCGFFLLIVLALVCAVSAAFAAGNSMNDATVLSLNTGCTDHMVSSDDVNYYKFTLPSDGCVSVSFAHAYVDQSANLWILTLHDSDKNVFFNTYYPGNVSSETTSYHLGMPAGTYYIKMLTAYDVSDSNLVWSGADYTLTVNYSASDAWETESNDTVSAADPISVGKDYHGVAASSSDVDIYRFTLSQAGYVSASFTHDYTDSSDDMWTLQIINAGSDIFLYKTYAGNVQNKVTAKKLGLPAGTYYVKVTGKRKLDYHFRIDFTHSDVWETEPNNQITDADQIPLNTKYNGMIWQCNGNYLDKEDYYQFTLQADKQVTLSFSHDYLDSSSGLCNLKIIDAQRKSYFTKKICQNDSGLTSDPIDLTAGTYYVEIENLRYFYRTGVEYTIGVYTEGNPPDSPGPDTDPIDISGCSIKKIKDQIYSGNEIKPSPVVKYNGEKLILNTDYTVSYRNNVKIGMATVVVEGTGKYAGTAKAAFRILPKGVSLKSLKAGKGSITVTWKKGKNISGYQVEYSLKSDFSGSKKVSVSGASTLKKKITGLKSGKKYYFRVRTYKKVEGKKYYSAWSVKKSKKVK